MTKTPNVGIFPSFTFRVRQGKHALQGLGGENMPHRVWKGETCIGKVRLAINC